MSKIMTAFGEMELTHPTADDLPDLIKLLASEDLDLRRLKLVSRESYFSLGRENVEKQWKTEIQHLKKSAQGVIKQTIAQLAVQAHGILITTQFPSKDTKITDPFNLHEVEKSGIETLCISQLPNILILKQNRQIIATARVLEVEGSWELVSLVTRESCRGKGLAKILILSILDSYKQRPLYSFQTLDLVGYYLKVYSDFSPTIPPFEELPSPLQRDLMYMNAFWGPNCIIKINT